MKKRFIFPFFNTFVGVILGTLVGYYVSRLELGLVLGGITGFALGGIIEFLLGRLGSTHWLYQRRVLSTVLLEIVISVFVVGPFAYVIVETQPDHHTVCCETPLDYGAKHYEDFRLEANGVTLAGWYVPPRENPGPVIVLLHGARGDRRGTAWHAQQLIRAGYGVLLYDQRALGESTGEKLSFSLLDGPDLLSVINNLASRPEVDPKRIGIVGLSLGAHIALNAAYIHPDKISALWLDGLGAQDIADFPAAENIGESFVTFLNDLLIRAAELYLGRQVPAPFSQILARLDHPRVLIVAGGLDDFERRASQKYAKLVGTNVQIWLIEQAEHVGGPAIIPEEYTRRMLEFFGMALGM